ncbi:MAG: 50S ribosomal protein L15 [Pseudomonadota bacterium]|uniref:50S ribosomal protein L15 n=1 Tax=Thermithiobacillus tepidarius TaxID=929 RepID=UPI00040F1AFD|nr:50S ribosomal protein L15 [Thermithiobacillus tepidarius]
MRLNSIRPAEGSKSSRKRVGRGIGSGLGKTAGRGHKGQHARAGGYTKVGFEGGQMPLQRRIPKRGFRSLHAGTKAEITLGMLASAAVNGLVDVDILRARRLIRGEPRTIKVIATGKVESPIIVRGLQVSAGARAAIEAAGGKVEA